MPAIKCRPVSTRGKYHNRPGPRKPPFAQMAHFIDELKCAGWFRSIRTRPRGNNIEVRITNLHPENYPRHRVSPAGRANVAGDFNPRSTSPSFHTARRADEVFVRGIRPPAGRSFSGGTYPRGHRPLTTIVRPTGEDADQRRIGICQSIDTICGRMDGSRWIIPVTPQEQACRCALRVFFPRGKRRNPRAPTARFARGLSNLNPPAAPGSMIAIAWGCPDAWWVPRSSKPLRRRLRDAWWVRFPSTSVAAMPRQRGERREEKGVRRKESNMDLANANQSKAREPLSSVYSLLSPH